MQLMLVLALRFFFALLFGVLYFILAAMIGPEVSPDHQVLTSLVTAWIAYGISSWEHQWNLGKIGSIVYWSSFTLLSVLAIAHELTWPGFQVFR